MEVQFAIIWDARKKEGAVYPDLGKVVWEENDTARWTLLTDSDVFVKEIQIGPPGPSVFHKVEADYPADPSRPKVFVGTGIKKPSGAVKKQISKYTVQLTDDQETWSLDPGLRNEDQV